MSNPRKTYYWTTDSRYWGNLFWRLVDESGRCVGRITLVSEQRLLFKWRVFGGAEGAPYEGDETRFSAAAGCVEVHAREIHGAGPVASVESLLRPEPTNPEAPAAKSPQPAPKPATDYVLTKAGSMIAEGLIYDVAGTRCIAVIAPLALAKEFLSEHGRAVPVVEVVG